MRVFTASLALSLALASFACGSSSSPPSAPASTVSATGTIDGKPFTAVAAIGYVNQGDAGPGVLSESIVLSDQPLDCSGTGQNKGHQLLIAFPGTTGATVDFSKPGATAIAYDYAATPEYAALATAGTLTVVKAATATSDQPDAGATDDGHVTFDVTVGADHVSGSADYLLCF